MAPFVTTEAGMVTAISFLPMPVKVRMFDGAALLHDIGVTLPPNVPVTMNVSSPALLPLIFAVSPLGVEFGGWAMQLTSPSLHTTASPAMEKVTELAPVSCVVPPIGRLVG